MARIVPNGVIEERDGVVLIGTGRLLPQFNFAALLRAPDHPSAALARARQFFVPLADRFMLSASDSAAPAIGPSALAAGMQPGRSTRMLFAPLVGQPPAVEGLVIRAVADTRSLMLYNDTMTAGFGGGSWALPEILQDAAFLNMPDVTHYLGYLDGQPVATAMRFTSHRVAVIANVSTVSAQRRQGIGEAMTWRAVLDGRDEGCVAAYLQASQMGLPLYRRMGFCAVTSYQTWLGPTR